MVAGRAIRKRRRGGANNSYWMSYSDMMAALLLMFVLLLFIAFNRYISLQTAKELELAEKEGQLQTQEAQLAEAQIALNEREAELATIRSLLNTQQLELDISQSLLDDKNAALVQSQAELDQSLAQLILQQAQIEEQERLLALSQEEIDAARAQLDAYSARLATQEDELAAREILLSAKDAELLIEQLRVNDLEAILNAQRSELAAQAVRIDELVGVRARIIEQLRDAFAAEGLNVSVDTRTGAITMDSTVFFDTNRAVLKPEGRDLLARLLPVYFKTLMSRENIEYVGEIIIEGHTDSSGTYEHNLDLSQRRALAVVNYCLGAEFTGMSGAEKEALRAIITANGRSESQLIYDRNGVEDQAASRRVEIKFRLKDAEMIESLNRILVEIGE